MNCLYGDYQRFYFLRSQWFARVIPYFTHLDIKRNTQNLIKT